MQQTDFLDVTFNTGNGKNVEPNIYTSLWFDPTGNQNTVFGFIVDCFINKLIINL